MDWINKLVMQHVLAEPGIVAVLAYALGRVDDLIFFALRFVDAATLDAYVDRLDAIVKARINKDAANPPPPAAPAAPPK